MSDTSEALLFAIFAIFFLFFFVYKVIEKRHGKFYHAAFMEGILCAQDILLNGASIEESIKKHYRYYVPKEAGE